MIHCINIILFLKPRESFDAKDQIPSKTLNFLLADPDEPIQLTQNTSHNSTMLLTGLLHYAEIISSMLYSFENITTMKVIVRQISSASSGLHIVSFQSLTAFMWRADFIS